jgi:GNAT superfamily N-acetyltransferase
MEIGAPPQVQHQTFGWDTTTGQVGAIQPFLTAGFRLNQNVVLTAQRAHPPPNYTQAVTVRPLSSDADWEQALANQIRCREPDHEESGYALFKQRQMARYRAMAVAGLGAWFGAFIGEQLVADAGVFHHRELARFQEVETHPDYRKRGIGGTLVYEAARYALAHYGIQTLVIVADRDSAPARLYASLGFEPAEAQVGLEWTPALPEGERAGG